MAEMKQINQRLGQHGVRNLEKVKLCYKTHMLDWQNILKNTKFGPGFGETGIHSYIVCESVYLYKPYGKWFNPSTNSELMHILWPRNVILICIYHKCVPICT